MAFDHRKLLSNHKKPKFTQNSAIYNDCYLCYVCPENCYLTPPPPPPPQFTLQQQQNSSQNSIPIILILMLCVLGVLFLVLSYLTLARYRRRSNPVHLEPYRTFLDENQAGGTALDHPIWYIRTVGLPQSVIDSIASFPYTTSAGIADGNCAVCLNDFREDETLRLLPKCSHAFHLSCIDTWLLSHKNCPVCRAPVLPPADASAAVIARASPVDPSPSRSGSGRVEGNESGETVNGDAWKNAGDGEVRRVRRSVSMDFSDSSVCRVMKRSLSFSGKRSVRKNAESNSAVED